MKFVCLFQIRNSFIVFFPPITLYSPSTTGVILSAFPGQYARIGQYEVRALQITENAAGDSRGPLLGSNNSYLDLLVSGTALLTIIVLMEMELSGIFLLE